MGSSSTWSRRRALVVGASVVGAAALSGPFGSAAAATTAPSSTPAVTGLRRDHWTPFLGQRIGVTTPAGRVRPAVMEVTDLSGSPAGDLGSFAVVLRIDRDQPTIAGLNPINLPGRGVATLLISAVDRGHRHRYFQIVVNNPAP